MMIRSQKSEVTKRSLWGSLEYPKENRLASHLTANVDNSRIRCDYKGPSVNNSIECLVVVVNYNGEEVIPKAIDPDLKIQWFDPTDSGGKNNR